jgi:hypothetical protein
VIKIDAKLRAPGWSNWIPRHVSGRGGRSAGKIGGETLLAHVCHNEEERWCGLLPGSVLFSLVAPALQPVVVGSYPVWGVWFPGRLLLDGMVISRILGHNRWPVVPEVLDTDNVLICLLD